MTRKATIDVCGLKRKDQSLVEAAWETVGILIEDGWRELHERSNLIPPDDTQEECIVRFTIEVLPE